MKKQGKSKLSTILFGMITSVALSSAVDTFNLQSGAYITTSATATNTWKISADGDMTATYENGLLTISGNGNMNDWETFQPPWFDFLTEITTVLIYDDVEYICDNAFFDCEQLQTIYYGGATLLDWKNITSEQLRSSLDINVKIYYYRATMPNEMDIANTWHFGDDNLPVVWKSEPSSHTHIFTVYTSNKDATCLKDGTKTAKCDKCDATDTVTDRNSKLGHSFVNYISNKDATCTKDGTKTAKCVRCSETNTVTDVGSKKEHTYVQVGEDEICSECGDIKTEPLSPFQTIINLVNIIVEIVNSILSILSIIFNGVNG